MKQVWSKGASSEEALSALPDMALDLHAAADEGFHPDEAACAESELHDESGTGPDQQIAAPAPFANISDFAFWEGLSGADPDDVDVALDAHVPAEAIGAIELVQAPVAGEVPSVALANPIAGQVPIVAPVVHWTNAMATPSYSVSVRLAPQVWGGTGQGLDAASALPASSAGPAAASGIVVTRKVREAAAPAPRRKLPRHSDIAPEAAPVLSHSVAFELPPIEFLAEPPDQMAAVPVEVLQQNAGLLEGVLEDFNIRGEIVQACPGPVVTLYELEPAPGIKSSRVISLADDIARSMSAVSARVAVVQGKNAIGIELPNVKRETVFLRELLASQDFEGSKHKLALCLGKTIGGEPVIVDLAKMPHLLVAGTTGSGKSVAINTMILSLLYRLKPEQCRLIMVDPKMLELSVYDG
ncbi:MAG TPA: DNA translocase FtsK, partial [Bosea sp. (in: a-proteobacteria)]|nr:DNA translocase FtsK [Bosea sp. (in: a-proteobacteria)]